MSILTIENLFKLLVIDIKNIFSLDIDVVESTSSKSHFSSNKAKEEDKYRIYYSKDAAKAEIHTVEDLMQYVVIFGHELTHCINKHNAFRSSLKEENVAIESMADFQGARIATALYTWGDNLKKVLKEDLKYPDELKKRKIEYSKLMGRVFSKLYKDFYQENMSSSYPHPCKRVGLNIAGVASFFYRMPQYQKQQGEYLWIHFYALNALDEDIRLAMGAYEEKKIERNNLLEVHRSIQGDKLQITAIDNIRAEPIFGTYYYKTDAEYLKHKEKMKEEILSYAKNSGLSELINLGLLKES